jgi:hypothetical protein
VLWIDPFTAGRRRRRADRHPEADMKKMFSMGLVALLGACSSEKPREIQWGAQSPPTTEQGAAVADALVTLQANLGYQQTSDPESGIAGFADEILKSLSAASASAPGTSAKLTGDAVRQAMTGVCGVPTVSGDVTTYMWTSCQIDGTDVGMPMSATIDGWLTWNPTLGETRWEIDETVSLTLPMDGVIVQDDTTAHLTGNQTVTATTIVASTSTVAHSHATYGGLVEDSDATVTLDANLTYESSPTFCITGGTLEVVQQQQPAFPEFQGFELTFTGTGCSEFVISRGI